LSLKSGWEFLWNASFEGFWIWIILPIALALLILTELQNPGTLIDILNNLV
jgi:hypothetical protein